MTLSPRPAAPGDAAAIARIYSEGIADRVATFETEPRSAVDIRPLLEARLATHPAVVVERDGEVVAFAWVGPYSERPCYAGIGEFSVYVAREARGTGAGTVALAALLDACERRGFWKLVSRVFPENAASRRLCARQGFAEVGVHRRHARLDGAWRDVVVVERLLGEAARETALGRPPGNPTPPPGRAEPYRSSKGLSMT
jgi:phosphinothricin acetyltransferase